VRWIGRRYGRRQDRRCAASWSPEDIAQRIQLDFADDPSNADFAPGDRRLLGQQQAGVLVTAGTRTKCPGMSPVTIWLEQLHGQVASPPCASVRHLDANLVAHGLAADHRPGANDIDVVDIRSGEALQQVTAVEGGWSLTLDGDQYGHSPGTRTTLPRPSYAPAGDLTARSPGGG
jgi:hypothetical protein